MRRILIIALVLGGVFVSVMASPSSKTVARVGTNATLYDETMCDEPMHNVIVVHGLHIALPYDMKNFPVELVALP
ncbi:MAG: hypothetical protein ACM3IH_23570 [Sphingobacteriales bacterium]